MRKEQTKIKNNVRYVVMQYNNDYFDRSNKISRFLLSHSKHRPRPSELRVEPAFVGGDDVRLLSDVDVRKVEHPLPSAVRGFVVAPSGRVAANDVRRTQRRKPPTARWCESRLISLKLFFSVVVVSAFYCLLLLKDNYSFWKLRNETPMFY